MNRIDLIRILYLLMAVTYEAVIAQSQGSPTQNIFQFLKATPATQKFIELLERSANAANDNTIISSLNAGASANSLNRTLPIDQTNTQNGFTVFAPVNEAITKLNDQQQAISPDILRNDIYNLVLKQQLNLEGFTNMSLTTTQTFGFMPRLKLRSVPNPFARQLVVKPVSGTVRKRQAFNQTSLNQTQTNTNLYEQYEQNYGQKPVYDGPNISPKMPNDQLYLINGAIILDRFVLTNGIVYLIDTMPQYYDKSTYTLIKENTYTGLAQNLNFWINRAEQSFKDGNENLRNALNAYGPNTFFLPVDTAFNKFPNRDLLNNNSYLVDVLLKSHRVSNLNLFDYYLDDMSVTYYTDSQLPVSTSHRYVDGKLDIEISIGHVKGKMLPNFRNIYCASGVIHLIDTVLGIASETAYTKIANNKDLATFKQLIDKSAKYSSLLNTSPVSQNSTASTFQLMTILAPNEIALLGIKEDLLANTSMIDSFLGTHIITNPSNNLYFTDHDASVFKNGQQYNSLSGAALTAIVKPDSDGIGNDVTFSLHSTPAIKSTIVYGNDLASNGVIHVVDKPLSLLASSNMAALLERYASVNSPSSPAFNQFVDALRSTGIFNDLKQPDAQYTLFIPTNDALARYQYILKGTDQTKIKELLYRHICKNQNLQSINLGSNTTGGGAGTGADLICRNGLGQDLTLTKDSYGLISKWQGMASSKIINDFPGLYASAYVLETPLLNTNLENMGLINVNSADGLKKPNYLCLVALGVFMLFF